MILFQRLSAIFKVNELDKVKVTFAGSVLDLTKLYYVFDFINGLFCVVLTVRAKNRTMTMPMEMYIWVNSKKAKWKDKEDICTTMETFMKVNGKITLDMALVASKIPMAK